MGSEGRMRRELEDFTAQDRTAEAVDLTAWELEEPAGSMLRLTLCYEAGVEAQGRLAVKLPTEAARHLARTLLRVAGR
jgi:hypothetical protein